MPHEPVPTFTQYVVVASKTIPAGVFAFKSKEAKELEEVLEIFAN